MSKITEKMIEKFCDSIKITESMIKLRETTKIEEINSTQMQKILINLYSSRQSSTKVVASILNSIFSQEATVFITSKLGAGYLVKNDANIEDPFSFRSPVYKKAMATMFENEIIKVIEPPKNRKAGLYQVIDPIILTIIDEVVGKKFRSKKEERTKEWFFTNYDNKEEKKTKSIKESFMEAVEKAKEEKMRKISGES